MAQISYELHQIAEDTIYNEIARAQQNRGFQKLKNLENAVKQQLKAFSCPRCGSKEVQGSGVRVNYRKLHLKEQTEKKGLLFNSTKTVSLGDRFLVDRILVKDGLIGLLAGSVKCGNCKWKVKGGSQTTWMSPSDFF